MKDLTAITINKKYVTSTLETKDRLVIRMHNGVGLTIDVKRESNIIVSGEGTDKGDVEVTRDQLDAIKAQLRDADIEVVDILL